MLLLNICERCFGISGGVVLEYLGKVDVEHLELGLLWNICGGCCGITRGIVVEYKEGVVVEYLETLLWNI